MYCMQCEQSVAPSRAIRTSNTTSPRDAPNSRLHINLPLALLLPLRRTLAIDRVGGRVCRRCCVGFWQEAAEGEVVDDCGGRVRAEEGENRGSGVGVIVRIRKVEGEEGRRGKETESATDGTSAKMRTEQGRYWCGSGNAPSSRRLTSYLMLSKRFRSESFLRLRRPKAFLRKQHGQLQAAALALESLRTRAL
jgi:hypothetical protein